MIRRSLRLQVAVFAVLGIVACFTVSFAVALWFPTPEPRRVSIAEAAQALRAVEVPPGWRRSVVKAPPFAADDQGRDGLIRAALASELGAPRDDVRVRSLDRSRTPAPSATATSLRIGEAAFDPGARAVARFSLRPGSHFRLFEAAVRRPDGSWLLVTPRTPILSAGRLRMLAAMIIAAGLILPLALWGCSILTAPFRRLEQAAADDARLDSARWVGGPVEAQGAAAAMDAMRRRLVDHLQNRTAMMAAIAHDLRTPLTGLRLRVEGLTGAARDEAVADIARMERMIAQLLTYVRGEEAVWVTEPVDLVDVLEDGLRRHRLAGQAVSLRAAGEHLVRGDRDQLDRAFANLIDNALAYGGLADIAVVSEGGVTTCTIDDDGPGIAAGDIDAVFLPFQRLEASRNRNTGGAGLGLAIAKAILTRAGGQIDLKNRAGGGLRAEVRLPALDRDLGS